MSPVHHRATGRTNRAGNCILALGKLKRCSNARSKSRLDHLAFHPPAQEIGPQESVNGLVSLANPPTRRQFAGE